MSKISEIIARVDAYKPNDFSEAMKLKWLNDLDGKIGLDVFLMDITEIRARQLAYPEGMEQEPLVTFPHEDIYDLYLAAKIDYENGEYNRYQNTMAAYNEAYGNFVRWLARTYQPAQGYIRGGCGCKSNPPYYITAYGLACQMGYQGTLEQWVESLPGKDGVTPVLSIGTVTALPAGSNPIAKLTGTAEKPVLELGIPAAPVGATSEMESAEHPGCWYRTVDGETEWLNPPMVAGVEYRTTERYNGLPVYTMLVDCGSVHDSGGAEQETSFVAPIALDHNTWVLEIFDMSGVVAGYLDTTHYNFCDMYACDQLKLVDVNYHDEAALIYVRTTGNDTYTDSRLKVTLKYVKNYF